MLNKVPEVTLYFWVIKILCTTVGETFADYLNDTLGFGLNNTAILMTAALAVTLVFQFRARRYIPGVYWLAVVLISVVGTLLSDKLVDDLGVPLQTSHDRLRGAAGDHVRGLVRQRAHTVDPLDRDHASRDVLLADDPVHVRAGHVGRRPVRRADGGAATGPPSPSSRSSSR